MLGLTYMDASLSLSTGKLFHACKHMYVSLVLARAAQKVAQGVEPDSDDDDSSGDDASHREGEDWGIEGTGKLFGHLHVCFRDFSFEGDEKMVLKQLFQVLFRTNMLVLNSGTCQAISCHYRRRLTSPRRD